MTAKTGTRKLSPRSRGDRQKTTSLIKRQWALLQMLPTDPDDVTTTELATQLADVHGIDVPPRTLQRELHALAAEFSIKVDSSQKPFRWSWKRDAPPLSLPALDKRSALLVLLVDKHLRAALPPALEESVAALTAPARQVLLSEETKLGDWLRRVRVVPRFLPLVPPRVPREVITTAAAALLSRRRLALSYRGRRDATRRDLIVNPLGFIIRDAVIYLLATEEGADDANNVHPYALHRATRAKQLEQRRVDPTSFDIDAFIAEGRLNFVLGDEPISVHIRFDPLVAHIPLETPITKDQQTATHPDGSVEVTAELPDTQQLRAWILGFGSTVEVLGPPSLRAWAADTSRQMLERYEARELRHKVAHSSATK